MPTYSATLWPILLPAPPVGETGIGPEQNLPNQFNQIPQAAPVSLVNWQPVPPPVDTSVHKDPVTTTDEIRAFFKIVPPARIPNTSP